MRIHGLTVERSLASLNTSPAGLGATEAARRLAEYGANHFDEVRQQHLLLRFAQEFTHFFAIILWIGAALSFLADHFDPGQGMARLGLAIVGVVIINGIFSFWQEYKAERAVDALRQLLPQQVQALRDEQIVELLASALVPGDIILLEAGNFVPADCRLIGVLGLRVNLSTVAGESLAKARTVEPSRGESALQARNNVLCRHPLRSSLAGGFGSNRMLQLGIASELAVILFILYTPAGNWLFGTAPMDSAPWLLAIACALLMGLLEELRKALLRHRANTKD